VFRSDTVFNTLAVEQVTSQDMLAAMFAITNRQVLLST